MCVSPQNDAGAVVAHSLLGSLSILSAAIEQAEDGVPFAPEFAITCHRHIERLAQFLTMLSRGQGELAASVLAGAR